jgi:DNA ligase-1
MILENHLTKQCHRVRSRCLLLALLLCLQSSVFAETLPLQQVRHYTAQTDTTGWLMSEKLDGIRGYWTGKKLLTRTGKPLHAPDWFIIQFPPFPLDGELWRKRDDFHFVQRTVLDSTPSTDWHQITFNVFEVPEAEGNFRQRLSKLEVWLQSNPSSPIKIIEQVPCKGTEHLYSFLHEVESGGGEGVIVKNPSLPFSSGSHQVVLKVKSYQTMEGEVIGYNPGKGQFKAMMGSLTLRLSSGLECKIGSGFTLSERKNPPPLGSIIVIKHHGLTKNGVPRFATYLRTRKD